MKRIAYFAHTGHVSGPNSSLIRLLRALDRSRFTPTVYFPSNGPVVEELSDLGEKCRVIPMAPLQRDLRYFPQYLADFFQTTRSLRCAFKKDEVDLVHINTCVTPYPGVAARSMGIPVLWHIRESLRRSTLNDWYLRLVAMLACRVVAVSRSVLQDVLARTGIRQDKVNVIYNGIDLDWFDLVSSHDKTRAELGLVEGKKLVSLPAFLLPHKGHQILLEAMSILVHKMGIKQVCAVIIGEEAPDSQDRFTSELQAYCRANSLEEYVCFLGFRSDTPALLAHSDIICLPATYDDPLPNVVLEGMAVGKPVVASSAGGIPELIDDQRTGLLVPRGKPKELALALAELITDESRAVRLGQAGRHRAEREFSSRIHAERVQTVYKELLAK